MGGSPGDGRNPPHHAPRVDLCAHTRQTDRAAFLHHLVHGLRFRFPSALGGCHRRDAVVPAGGLRWVAGLRLPGGARLGG